MRRTGLALGPVVHGVVEAEVLHELADLVGDRRRYPRTTGRTSSLANRPGGRTHRPGGGRDEDRVAFVQFADPLHPDPRREAGLAEDPVGTAVPAARPRIRLSRSTRLLFAVVTAELHAEPFPDPPRPPFRHAALYVYSATAIRERYRTFNNAFREIEHTVCYSVKANSNLSILKLLAKLG